MTFNDFDRYGQGRTIGVGQFEVKPDNLDLPPTLTLATVNRRLEVNQIYNDSIRSRFAQIEQKPKRKHGDHFILVKMSNEK